MAKEGAAKVLGDHQGFMNASPIMPIVPNIGNWWLDKFQPKVPIRAAYLAGPIDAVSVEEARDWQDTLADRAKNIIFFSPAHPYRNPTFETADILDEINRAAIDACQCVVAYLPGDRTAFGTIREIEYAKIKGYPVMLIAPDGNKSFLTYDLKVVDSITQAGLVLQQWANTGLVGPNLFLAVDNEPNKG